MYLPSNTGDFVNNTLSDFKVKLPTKIDLDGDWEVALVEISYPITWLNVGSEEEGLISVQFKNALEYRQKSIPLNNYNTIDGLCDAINFTLDNMRSFNGEKINVNFQYDNIRHRVGVKPLSEMSATKINLLRISPHLQYMLGFKSRELSLTTGKLEVIFIDTKEVVADTIDLSQIKWSTRSDEEDMEMFQRINVVLNRLKNNQGKTPDCNFKFFPAKSEIVLESRKRKIVSINISKNLQYSLGLSDNIIYPNVRYKVKDPSYMKTPEYCTIAEGAPDIRAAQYALFVYCDIVRPQIVGNTLTPLLRAVSIRGRHGDIVDEQYDNPHYVPVLKREFGIIKINISDDRGRLVNFEYGKLFVKLHFRMKQ